MPTTKRLTERKREAILQAAISEFRQHGFEATSMDNIAAAACVSKRTVYNHFPSKDELFSSMLLHLWNHSESGPSQLYRSDIALREQLLGLLQAKMQMFADAHFMDLARVAIAATIHAPERAERIVARLGEKEEGMSIWIRAAQADGKLKHADPVFAAHQLLALLKASAFWPQITLGQAALSAEAADFVVASSADMFLACYATTTSNG